MPYHLAMAPSYEHLSGDKPCAVSALRAMHVCALSESKDEVRSSSLVADEL